MVTAFFERLGNLGVLLIAGALLLGGLAGAAVAHHYDRLASETVASQQHTDKGEQKQDKKNGQGKQKHPTRSTDRAIRVRLNSQRRRKPTRTSILGPGPRQGCLTYC